MEVVYFQPPGISPKYCEAGTHSVKDPSYIHYLDEPCKILASAVKIIPKERVAYDKKLGLYIVS